MWRTGVSCKMRRLWTPFSSQVYGCPTTQLQIPSSLNASLFLLTNTFISWQQSTGNEEIGSGAVLFKQSLQMRINYALSLGDKKMATNLLKYLGSMEDSIEIEDCMPLLKYCCKTSDPEFALHLWRFMDEKKLNINRSGYLYILHALTKGGYLDEALYLLKLLGENSFVKPRLSMYNIFLNGCSKYHSLQHANSCLELMEKHCTGKSEITYVELMKLAVHGHNILALKQVWEEYKKFYSPSILSLQKLIQFLCRLRASAEANDALQRMVLVVLKGGSILQRSQNNWFYSSKVLIPVPLKASNEATTEVCIQKHGTTGLRDVACPDIFGMDVLSVPLPSKNGEAVKSNDWDILNHIQEDKTDIRKELSFDFVEQKEVEIHLLNDNGKYDVEHSKETTVTLQDDTLITGLPSNRKLFYSKHLWSSLNDMNGHSIAGERCKIEGTFSEGGELRHISSLPALNVLRQSFNEVIHLATLTRNYDLAEHLFAQMQSLGLEPSLDSYNVFLEAVVLGRGVVHGMKVVKAMENKNLKPNNLTYATLAVGYSRSQQLDQAEEMLDQMVETQTQYIHAFHNLLVACCIADEAERAVRVLARMRHFQMKPNIRTYELLFSLFGNVNHPYEQGDRPSQEAVSKRINAIKMDMVRNGVEHSQTSMRNLLRAVGGEGMMKELLSHLHDAEDHFNGRDAPLLGTRIYNVVLHSLVESKEYDVTKDIFERMKSLGIKPDIATYNIMIDCYSLDGDLDLAHGLMDTMLQNGYKHHACNYTSLMKLMLRKDEFEEVLYLLNKMKGEGIHSDVICYNTIFRDCSTKARFDIIELLVEHMHRQKVQPDPETCLRVFASYHERGFFDTALEALQVLSVHMMAEDESVQREMRATFEELVLDESPNVEETLVEIFKDSKEYLSAALFNMRLCALSGVTNSWVPDESPWAIRLSLQYNENFSVGQ